jgi:hypothetical protein
MHVIYDGPRIVGFIIGTVPNEEFWGTLVEGYARAKPDRRWGPNANALAFDLPASGKDAAPADPDTPNVLDLKGAALIAEACRVASKQGDEFAAAFDLGLVAAKDVSMPGNASVLSFKLDGDPWFRGGGASTMELRRGAKVELASVIGLSTGKENPDRASNLAFDALMKALGQPKQLADTPVTEPIFAKMVLLAEDDGFAAYKIDPKPGASTVLDEEAMARHRRDKPKLDPDWLLPLHDLHYDYAPSGGPTCRLQVRAFKPEKPGATSHVMSLQILYPVAPIAGR